MIKVSDHYGQGRSFSQKGPCINKHKYFPQFLCIDPTMHMFTSEGRQIWWERKGIVLVNNSALHLPFKANLLRGCVYEVLLSSQHNIICISLLCASHAVLLIVLSPWTLCFPLQAIGMWTFQGLFVYMIFASIRKKRVTEAGSLNLSEPGLTHAFFVHPYCILHLFLKWDLECQGGCKQCYK